jgi:hypothetical protein
MSLFPTPVFRLSFLFLAGSGLALAQSVSLSVDVTQPVRVVDERVFGLNAVLWDPQTAGAQTIALLQAADIRAIRVPGGSLSDEYHWRTNTSLANTWTWSAGFNASGQLIASFGAEAFVTVNYGTGTPEEAAAWVAYANASPTLLGTVADVALGTDAKGFDWKTAGYWSALRNAAPLGANDGSNFLRVSRGVPYELKYWEIGNENYGTWETDQQAVPNDPYTYAVRAKAYIAKMKAVDPTIKVGVVAVTGENSNANNTSHPATNPRTGVAHNGWTPVMLATLKSLGVTPDFLIYHRYEQAPAADSPGNPEADARLLQAAKTWPQDATDLRQQLTDYLGAAGAGVELAVTENNSVYAKPGKQTTSLVNGLYYADSLGSVLQTEINALVWWDLRNGQETANNNAGSLYGWRNYGDYGILSTPSTGGSATYYDAYPTYHMMKLLANFARGGDTVVRATSSSSLLAVYAVRRTSGTLGLLVINKDPTNTLAASIALTGYTPATNANVYSYGMPQDNAARPGGSGSPEVATGSMTVGGSAFTASFAPYSATVISLAASSSPATPVTPVTPTAPTPGTGGSSGGGGGGAPSGWFVGALVLMGVGRRLRR